MRAVVQRVTSASVSVDDKVTGEINDGLLVFLGVTEGDCQEDMEWLLPKIVKLRIFEDDEGKMNRSVQDTGGGILLISQFTLYGNVKKGTRPSYNRAAHPSIAEPMYLKARHELANLLGKPVPTGVFGAHMVINAVNDGPVTIIIDSADRNF